MALCKQATGLDAWASRVKLQLNSNSNSGIGIGIEIGGIENGFGIEDFGIGIENRN